MESNVFTTPINHIIELENSNSQLSTQLTQAGNTINKLQTNNVQLLNACNQTAFESQQKDAVIVAKDQHIFQLTAQLAKAKAEHWETARTFTIMSNGEVFSIEPNNHRKPVGFFTAIPL